MLKIVIRPSRHLALLLCVGHGVAAGLATVVSLPLWLLIPLLVLIAASFVLSVYGPALLRRKTSIVGLEIGAEGTVNVQTRAGEWRESRLLDTSFVFSWLTVLNVAAPNGAVCHVVVLGDSMAADEFRRLRVWLRWTKNPRVARFPGRP